MTLFAGLESIVRPDVPLRNYTWYGLGGPARWFATPRTDAEAVEVLARCGEGGVPWRVLGRGANLLVRDEGVDGVVLTFCGEIEGPPAAALAGASRSDRTAFAPGGVRVDGARVWAGAGADFTKLVQHCVNRGLAGLENLAGIPGSMGGIIRMNAGGKHGSISQYVRRVRVLEADGRIDHRDAAAVGFAYRKTDLAGAVVLAAELELSESNPAALTRRFREIWLEKASQQPAVSERSCGCVFKNPPGQAAGALIDRAGMKGQRVGGAEISRRHANFIVAHNGATAKDVLDLAAVARDRVRSETGVELEFEVEIW
ncbi:UDP-N-acetylenolpyruvoylglucosamine reductase MurB [Phycisphaerae bacterium RAS1]|nr:UDP-N-acetylenolpyruvoylglucosamine reductase MurB [Phycisphaerae bacterium RAS1]